MVCTEPDPLARGRPGRPPRAEEDAIRRERDRAILDAASTCFLACGYRGTNLDDVVKLSGRSKPTIYRAFGNKQALLHALVRDRAARFRPCISLGRLSSAEGLPRLARALLSAASDPAWLDLLRLVIAEAPRQPELGKMLQSEALAPLEAELARSFEGWTWSDRDLSADATEIAAIFTRLVVGAYPLDLLADAHRQMTPSQRRQRICRAIMLFVRGAMPPPPVTAAGIAASLAMPGDDGGTADGSR